jgi:hypothetical protein
MGKLMVGLRRLLPLCALLLVLPSLMRPDRAFAQQLSAAITPTQGPPGTQVTGTGTIGANSTGYFIGHPGDRVQVRWDDASYTILANTTVGNDGTFSVSFTVPANATAGTHTITFNDLDAGTGYVIGAPTFTVGQATGTGVILERALTHNGEGDIGQEQTTFAPGDTIRYAAIVNNPGSSTVTPRFDFHATGPREIFSWTGDVPIPPGIWYFHLHVSVPADAPSGTYTHRVTMTYNGQITTKESLLTVGLVRALPDLSPTAILYNSADLVPGRTVFFDSGVQNAGVQGTGVFNIRWFVDGVSLGYGSHEGVPANSTVLNGNSQFSWVATEGAHTITFAVDVDNHVVESDESNNTRSVTVTVALQTAQPPHITLLGDNPLYHTQGCPFVGAGATALDAKDGDLTNSILITGTEQINNPGMYTITYTVTNSSRLSDTKTRQVIVFGAIGTPLCFVGKPAGKAPNLVILVHGCCTDATDVRTEWESFGKLIAENIHAPAPEQWEIVVWDWSRFTPKRDFPPSDLLQDPRAAYENIVTHPDEVYLNLKDAIANHPYKHVHLLGHSAGAKLIQLTAEELVRIYTQRNESPFIHLTFFDAFTLNDFDKNSYGFLPNNYQNYYSEHYVHRGFALSDISTDECLSSAFNFDITNWEHPSNEHGFLGHSWPHNWYKRSITSPSTTETPPKPGFKLSFEGGNDQFEELNEDYPYSQQCPLADEKTKCEPAACWQ